MRRIKNELPLKQTSFWFFWVSLIKNNCDHKTSD